MKKYLVILFMIITCAVNAQVVNTSVWFAPPASADTLGPEMISNGGFDDANDWTIVNNWTISGGVLIYDDVANNNVYQLTEEMISEIEPNTTYRVTCDIDISSGLANFRIANINNSVVYIDYANYADGFNIIRFTTPADVSLKGFLIRGTTDSGASFSIDNISMKKVL